MASTLNRWEGIGNLGADPEIRSLNNGDRVANLRLACSESWKDRNGDKQEKTEWVSIVVFNDRLIDGIIEPYAKKGSKLFVEGKLATRKYTDKDGNDRYQTEVVLQQFNGSIQLLGDAAGAGQRDGGDRGRSDDRGRDRSDARRDPPRGTSRERESFAADLDDEIPF